MTKCRREETQIRRGMAAALLLALAALTTPAFAQTGSPGLYDSEGKFLGNLNSNPYDPNSVANPYGPYGNRYMPNSINNPYGPYGSPYGAESVNNPHGKGLRICTGGPC